MPTVMTHAVVAAVAGKVFAKEKMPPHFWILAILCATIPDSDVIGFSFGVKYSAFLGHRGFFHSIFFAFLLSAFIGCMFFKKYGFFSKPWNKIVLFYFFLGASHGILDAFTNGGLGIALLAPFDNTRFFSPWAPITVSPLNLKAVFSERGMSVMVSEVVYIWLPLCTLLITIKVFRKGTDSFNDKT